MRWRAALALLALLASCNGNGGQSPSDAAPQTEAAVCDHDGCVVSLSADEVVAVCGPSLAARRTDCPGVTVLESRCGILLHLEIQTAGPKQDCWYTSDGTLVAAVLRSDAGFMKIAGAPPLEDCPGTSRACDHTPP